MCACAQLPARGPSSLSAARGLNAAITSMAETGTISSGSSSGRSSSMERLAQLGAQATKADPAVLSCLPGALGLLPGLVGGGLAMGGLQAGATDEDVQHAIALAHAQQQMAQQQMLALMAMPQAAQSTELLAQLAVLNQRKGSTPDINSMLATLSRTNGAALGAAPHAGGLGLPDYASLLPLLANGGCGDLGGGLGVHVGAGCGSQPQGGCPPSSSFPALAMGAGSGADVGGGVGVNGGLLSAFHASPQQRQGLGKAHGAEMGEGAHGLSSECVQRVGDDGSGRGGQHAGAGHKEGGAQQTLDGAHALMMLSVELNGPGNGREGAQVCVCVCVCA